MARAAMPDRLARVLGAGCKHGVGDVLTASAGRSLPSRRQGCPLHSEVEATGISSSGSRGGRSASAASGWMAASSPPDVALAAVTLTARPRFQQAVRRSCGSAADVRAAGSAPGLLRRRATGLRMHCLGWRGLNNDPAADGRRVHCQAIALAPFCFCHAGRLTAGVGMATINRIGPMRKFQLA